MFNYQTVTMNPQESQQLWFHSAETHRGETTQAGSVLIEHFIQMCYVEAVHHPASQWVTSVCCLIPSESCCAWRDQQSEQDNVTWLKMRWQHTRTKYSASHSRWITLHRENMFESGGIVAQAQNWICQGGATCYKLKEVIWSIQTKMNILVESRSRHNKINNVKAQFSMS